MVGNDYKMVLCVEECARALPRLEGYVDAAAYFRHVPDSLLYTEPLRQTTLAAADALAVALGPVEELWQPGNGVLVALQERYIIDERIAAYYALSLAFWWIMNQDGDDEAEQQPLFNRLLKSQNYARMSASFLASIAQIHGFRYSGLLHSIMTCAFWRRDVVPKRYSFKTPPSRVEEPDRRSYSVVFSTHFTRANVQALQTPDDRAHASLGILHGFPCYLLLKLKDGLLSVRLRSDYLRKDQKLAMPGKPDWGGQDNDMERSFEFTVVRGRVGTVNLEPDKEGYMGTICSTVPLVCPPDALVFDEAGKLKVEMELKVTQHKDC